MSNVIFELNTEGVRELLQSQEMQDALQEIATDIQGKCGPDYATDVQVMQTRAIASVYTDNESALKDNSRNNTLLKALG